MRVVVIGGGVIGFSAAHELAARGVDVTLLDMRGPGLGATQASAGMLAPYIEGHRDDLLRLGAHALALYDDFVRRVESDASRSLEYARRGSLQVAYHASHAATLEAEADRLSRSGIDHQLLEGHAVREHEPGLADGTLFALAIARHGYVHVPQLMDALVAACARRTVRVVVDRVQEIAKQGDHLVVRGERARVEGDVVVVAGGSWSGDILGDAAAKAVKPIRGQSLEVACPPPVLGRIVWSEDCYLVPREGRSIIVGATVEDVGFDESSTPEARTWLLEAAMRVVPALRAGGEVRVRVGLRPRTPDEMPLIGWSSTMPGVYLATGHYRNGILLAPLTAALVADAATGVERSELDWVRTATAPSRVEVSG